MNSLQLLSALGLWTAKSLVLLFTAWVATRFVRRSAAIRHAIWLSALVGVLLLPALTLIVPGKRIAVPLLRAPAASAEPAITPSDAELLLALEAAGADSSTSSPALNLPAATIEPDPSASQVDYPAWAIGAWTVGAVLLGLTALGGLVAVERLRRRSKLGPWTLNAARLAVRLSVRRPWQLRMSASSQPDTALTWGTIRPVVLLPRHSEEWPDDRLEAVLLHELAHVRRCDSLSQLVAFAACALFWFNPAAWLAARAMRAEAEKAADDAVLRAGITPSHYADELVRYAAALGRRRYPILSLGASFMKPSKLENRVRSIVDPANRRRGVSSVEALAVATLGMGAAFLFASLKPYPTVLQGLNDPTGPQVTITEKPSTQAKGPTTPVVVKDRTAIRKEKKLGAARRARLKAVLKKLAAIEAKHRGSRNAELTRAQIIEIDQQRQILQQIVDEAVDHEIRNKNSQDSAFAKAIAGMDIQPLMKLKGGTYSFTFPGGNSAELFRSLQKMGVDPFAFQGKGNMDAFKALKSLNSAPFGDKDSFAKLQQLKSLGANPFSDPAKWQELSKTLEQLKSVGASPFGDTGKWMGLSKGMQALPFAGQLDPTGKINSSLWSEKLDPKLRAQIDEAVRTALLQARAEMTAQGDSASKMSKEQAELQAAIEKILREQLRARGVQKKALNLQSADQTKAQREYEEAVRQMKLATEKMRAAETELQKAQLEEARARQAAAEKALKDAQDKKTQPVTGTFDP